jgi:hypothetical protein
MKLSLQFYRSIAFLTLLYFIANLVLVGAVAQSRNITAACLDANKNAIIALTSKTYDSQNSSTYFDCDGLEVNRITPAHVRVAITSLYVGWFEFYEKPSVPPAKPEFGVRMKLYPADSECSSVLLSYGATPESGRFGKKLAYSVGTAGKARFLCTVQHPSASYTRDDTYTLTASQYGCNASSTTFCVSESMNREAILARDVPLGLDSLGYALAAAHPYNARQAIDSLRFAPAAIPTSDPVSPIPATPVNPNNPVPTPVDEFTNCGIIDIPCNLRNAFIPRESWMQTKFQAVTLPSAPNFGFVVQNKIVFGSPRLDFGNGLVFNEFPVALDFTYAVIPQNVRDIIKFILWWGCFFACLNFIGIPFFRSNGGTE